jgi:hypothetical protein
LEEGRNVFSNGECYYVQEILFAVRENAEFAAAFFKKL